MHTNTDMSDSTGWRHPRLPPRGCTAPKHNYCCGKTYPRENLEFGVIISLEITTQNGVIDCDIHRNFIISLTSLFDRRLLINNALLNRPTVPNRYGAGSIYFLIALTTNQLNNYPVIRSSIVMNSLCHSLNTCE